MKGREPDLDIIAKFGIPKMERRPNSEARRGWGWEGGLPERGRRHSAQRTRGYGVDLKEAHDATLRGGKSFSRGAIMGCQRNRAGGGKVRG